MSIICHHGSLYHSATYTCKCDWCERTMDTRVATVDKHFHSVTILNVHVKMFGKPKILKKQHHMCTICVDHHDPFTYVDNGVVKFDHFKIKKTRKKQNGK